MGKKKSARGEKPKEKITGQKKNESKSKANHKHSDDIDKISIIRNPITWIVTLFKIIVDLIIATPKFIISHYIIFTIIPAVVLAFFYIDGPHAQHRQISLEIFWFSVWWIGLGIASSVGLGTGLHTFVLYLGPYMAKVAMVANECNRIPDFMPNRWTYQNFAACDKYEGIPTIGMLDIYYGLGIEAFLWGFGTAIGELPPYFVARAASEAGKVDEELESQEGYFKTVKEFLEKLLKRHAFIVVMLWASIPNPFFDLAGLLCGHFMISFWIFFGATVIGKACVKVTIQSFFVIFIFSSHTVEKIINLISSIFPQIEGFLRRELVKQKESLYRAKDPNESASILATVWSWFIILMVSYFIYAFLNAIIQKKLKEEREERANRN